MNHFHFQNNQLYCEGVPLNQIVQEIGTPVYVYSRATLRENAAAYQQAGEQNKLVCYAVKANQNPHILAILHDAGLGADVTSGGELFLALHAGIAPEKIIYSGVGKRRDEIEMALEANIRALHVESAMELDVIAQIATERQQVARIGVRVNPNIAVETHPYISTGLKAHKFGVAPETAVSLLHTAREHPWLQPVGIASHIGSQITDIAPFAETAQFLTHLAQELAPSGTSGIKLQYIDIGGGLGIDYQHFDIAQHKSPISQPPAPSPQPLIPDPQSPIPTWVNAVSHPIHQAGYNLVMEPGRSIVASAGILLTTVTYLKPQGEKTFVIVDAGMNDLLRPTLYKAYHPIWPINQPPDAEPLHTVDIVGPICESGDTFAQKRPLPAVQPGDILAIGHAGAYGYAMSSNYNGRLRPAEVLVNNTQTTLIRTRQTFDDLLAGVA